MKSLQKEIDEAKDIGHDDANDDHHCWSQKFDIKLFKKLQTIEHQVKPTLQPCPLQQKDLHKPP